MVEFSISFENDIISETEHYGETGPSERLNKKYYWDESKREQYILNLHEAESSFADLITNLTKAQLPVDIEQNIDIFFSKLMCDVCDPLFARHLGSSTENNNNAKQLNTSKQQWFDEECQESRDRFYRELN